MAVDVQLDYLAEAMLVMLLHIEVTLISPFLYCILREEVIVHTKCTFYVSVFNACIFLRSYFTGSSK